MEGTYANASAPHSNIVDHRTSGEAVYESTTPSITWYAQTTSRMREDFINLHDFKYASCGQKVDESQFSRGRERRLCSLRKAPDGNLPLVLRRSNISREISGRSRS